VQLQGQGKQNAAGNSITPCPIERDLKGSNACLNNGTRAMSLQQNIRNNEDFCQIMGSKKKQDVENK